MAPCSAGAGGPRAGDRQREGDHPEPPATAQRHLRPGGGQACLSVSFSFSESLVNLRFICVRALFLLVGLPPRTVPGEMGERR